MSLTGPGSPMPHKHNAGRRQHIPKMAFKMRNWPGYEAGLRRRGNLTLWIGDGTLNQCRRSDRAARLAIRMPPSRPR